MDRRGVLVATAAGISLLAGCLFADSNGNDDPRTSDAKPMDGGMDCPASGYIDVYWVADVPDDANLLDADADGLTDVTVIDRVLRLAAHEYELQTSNGETIEAGTRLASESGEPVAESQVRDTIGFESYVAYQGQHYRLRHDIDEC